MRFGKIDWGSYLLIATLFALFYSIPLTNGLFIAFVVVNIAIQFRSGWKRTEAGWLALLLAAPWLFEWISLCYTDDFPEGIKQVEKRLALILLPFVFAYCDGRYKTRTLVLKTVAMSISAAAAICLAFALRRYILLSENKFFWKDLTDPIDFHPSYMAMIINVICLWLCVEFVCDYANFNLRKKMGYLLLLSYLGILMILLASKIQIVIFFSILVVALFSFFGRYRITMKWILGLSALSVAIIFSFVKSGAISRFSSISTYKYQIDAPTTTFNELTNRLAILECSSYLIKANPIVGTGIGDVMSDLDSVYRKVDYKFGYLDQQDPHDQYLRLILGTGTVGLTLFVMTLAVPFWRAVRSKDYLLIGFIGIFGLSFLFESVLERHNGIIIYAILNSVLIFGQKPHPPEGPSVK